MRGNLLDVPVLRFSCLSLLRTLHSHYEKPESITKNPAFAPSKMQLRTK